MGNLEVKHLRMVASISETGNLTRAANHLGLSQSALSQQLKDIESRLGTQLFYRTRKQMLLTPLGRKIREAGMDILRSLEDTEADIARTINGDTGELKVGTQCIFCYRWLPRVMKAFQERYPNVDLAIGRSADTVRELSDNTHDLVITVHVEEPEDTESLPLFRDEMMVILPPDHPLAQSAFLEYSDFRDWNLLSTRPESTNRFFQSVLRPRAITPARYMIVEDPAAMIEMVSAGFGLALAPMWSVRSLTGSGRLNAVSITRQGLFTTWHATFLKSRSSPVFLKDFIRMLRDTGIPE